MWGRGRQSDSAVRIRSLSPCTARRSKPGELAERLLRDRCEPSCSTYSVNSAVGRDWVLGFPVALALGATRTGWPDLRIQLVTLRWGNAAGGTQRAGHLRPARDGAAGPARRPYGSASQPAHSGCGEPSFQCSTSRTASSSLLPSSGQCRTQLALQYLSTAGALVLFSLIHRDAAAAAGPALVAPGLAAATAAVVAATLRSSHKGDSSSGPGESCRSSSDGGGDGVHLASRAQRQGGTAGRGSLGVRQRLQGVAGGLRCVAGPASDLLQRVLIPSALLSLAGRAWRVAHSSSAALAAAVVDLVAVGLGYSCLAREAALGHVPPGRPQELAWRRRHKAAARRLARHLGDLPPAPPLAPALAALERCSISAGLAVGGVPLCGAVDALAAGAAAAAASAAVAGCQQQQLVLSLSYRHGKQRTARQGVVHGAAPPAAATAASPDAVNAPATARAASPVASGPAVAGSSQQQHHQQQHSSLRAPVADAGCATAGRVVAALPPVAGRRGLTAAPRRDSASSLMAMPAAAGAVSTASALVTIASAGPSAGRGAGASLTTPFVGRSSGLTTPSCDVTTSPPPPTPPPPAAAVEGALSIVAQTHTAQLARQSPPPQPDATASTAASLVATWDVRTLSPAAAAALLQQEQAAVEALGLPLYGRADHAQLAEMERPTGLVERLGLACRASYLIAVFLPFLTLGVVLLLLSMALTPRQRPPALHAPATAATANAAVPATVAKAAGAASSRGASHGGSSSGAATAVSCRRLAWRLLLAGCRRSGAAFIKWGQWAATRVDLFPDDFCEALSQLHDQAPTHSFAFTRRQVERSFGVPLELMFESFERQPVASGSIAQIHRAVMRGSDGSALQVAVKVVHPRVAEHIRQDFALLRPAAAALGRLRSLRSLSLHETVSQFSCTMTAQADLRVEAAHLRRFYTNFARVASQVTTPRPLPGLVRPEVMVETWEAGRGVSHYIRNPGPLNGQVVCLGVDTYLKMLLQDNFVHTDLHPGNIMVRMLDPEGRPMDMPPVAPAARAGAPSSSSSPSSSSPSPASSSDGDCAVQLVLLDFGLAEELTPAVRFHFISFLQHLMRGDGTAAAGHLLRWTSRRQACPDPAALTEAMVALAAARCDIHSEEGVDLDAVMKDVLRLARRHGVTIDSAYASLVIAVCVIVGFATSLDPGVNLVDPAVPAMLAHALTGRVVGRLYS